MKKLMSAKTYIRKKNEILKKHTGMVLVPEDQITECEAKPLSMRDDMSACPYCLAYENVGDCTGCPMYEANNGCLASYTSTYECMVRNLNFKSLISDNHPWHLELRELIHDFNKSHGFIKEEVL